MDNTDLKINEDDDDDSSSDELEIVLEDDNDSEEPKSKKRKRTENTDSSDDEDTPLPENCKKMEEKLCSTAAKNHLTDANVKCILKHVVSNEHVLAIVKLEEEEMEDEDETPEPKITRSKAKELKKKNPDTTWPMDLTPVKLIQVTSPEVTKLIEKKDLPDEEGSDEEYQPAPEEHDGSDDERDDTLGSQSDIDSQPRTPCTPGTLGLDVDMSPTKYTEDGLFKVPKEIVPSEQKSEPAIALRTRSRVCLSDKAIEEIEESFIPPDDDVEEYQIDDVWSEFIAEFTNPETPPEPANEDDEVNDPEYNASAEKVTVDLEELRDDESVKVSRKELNDLVAELFAIDDMLDIQESFVTAPNSDLVATTLPPNSDHSIQFPSTESPIKLLDISHSRNLLEHNEFQQKTCIEEIAQNISLTAENIEHNITQSNLQYHSQTVTEQPADVQVPAEQLSIKLDVLDSHSRIVSSSVQMIPKVTLEKLPPYYTRSSKPPKHLENCESVPKVVTEFDKEVSVFTPEMRQMLDQQMRMHIQLLTQNFLQLYGHPELWKYGPALKECLVDLKEKAGDNPYSALKASNLIAALDLCVSWEARLAEDTEEMRDMMQFIINEVKTSLSHKKRKLDKVMKFHKVFMETVLDSNVFLYPHFLPHIPFKVDFEHHDYLQSEDHLIAMGLEQFNQYIDDNPTIIGKHRVNRRIQCLSEMISTYTTGGRNMKGIACRIQKVRREYYPHSPIKYYFNHKKYPRVTFPILPFNPTWTPRDNPLCSLPEVWRFYLDPDKFKNPILVRLNALSDTLQQQRKIPPINPVEVSHRSPSEISPRSPGEISSYSSPPSSPIESIPHRNLPNHIVISQNCEPLSDCNGLTPSNPLLHFQLKSIGGGQFALTPILQTSNVPKQGFNENRVIAVEKTLPNCRQTKKVILPSKRSTRSSSKVNTIRKNNPAPSKDKVLPVKPSETNKTPTPKDCDPKSVKKNSKKGVKKKVPNDLKEGIPHDRDDTISISSDDDECAIVSTPLPTFTPSVAKAIVNGCQSTQIIPSHHRFHRCPCEYNVCNTQEDVLPKNQTLLTQFFKRANGTSKRSECTVVKLEKLDNSQPPKSVSENNKPDSEVSHISCHSECNTAGCAGNCLIRVKLAQEELLIDHIPLHEECNGQVDELSSDDQLSQNDIHIEEPLDTDISNEYNNENHTLSTILSKLQYLLIVNKKRRELLAHKNNHLYKLKSDLAWKVRAKLFEEIQDVESMLPSMPNLASASKSGLEGPDEYSLLSGIPTPVPDEHTEFVVPETQSDIKKPEEKSGPIRLRKSPRAGFQSTKDRLAARAQRELEANKAMFAKSDPTTNDLKETACATAYFEKVQSRLTGNSDPYVLNRFTDFQDILENYDPEKETPCNLYQKLNAFFGPEHEDLTEEFLTFLTAGQAVEVGRFMDHFMLTNMSDFIERLQIYFSRRPAQLRKILWCLEKITENIETSSDSVTIESIKATVLPHLKGNKHLVNWFLRLLPNEKPPDSQMQSGFEVLDVEGLSKNIESGNSPEHLDYEVLNIPPIEDTYGTDQCACTCHNSSDDKYKSRSRHCIPCGTKYMQGRLYIQNGRGLRAARVEWGGGSEGQARRLTMPPQHPPVPYPPAYSAQGRRRGALLDPPQPRDSDDEKTSPKRVMRAVRTPTSKTKYTRVSKNSAKSGDIEETSNKPSCSKSIIRDENLTENPLNVQSIDNLETLANVLPENEPQEEQGIPNDLAHCNGHPQETSPQQPVEDIIIDSPLPSTAPSTSSTEQSNEISNNTLIKTECIEIPLHEDGINMDPETTNEEVEPVIIKTENELCWTREEDKAILLVLQNESDSDYTFEKIQEILPHRSIGEIRDRFQSVMLLLQQMASSST